MQPPLAGLLGVLQGSVLGLPLVEVEVPPSVQEGPTCGTRAQEHSLFPGFSTTP